MIAHVHGSEDAILLEKQKPPSNLLITEISVKILGRQNKNWKVDSKIHMEFQRIPQSQNSL